MSSQAPQLASVLPAPAHAAKLHGKRMNSTPAGASGRCGRTVRSSRDGDSKNFFRGLPCDSPRPLRQNTRTGGHEPADGSDRTAADGIASLPPWPDTPDWPATSTNDAPPAGTPSCSNDTVDDGEQTTVRTPSADTGEPGDETGTALDLPVLDKDDEVGPREVLLPEGQASRGSWLLLREAFLIHPDSLPNRSDLPA